VYVDAHALLCDVAWRTELMEAAARAVAPLVARQGIGAVVGSESSGIAFAAWLADRLGLPMLYLRKRPIGWGVQAQLQGRLPHRGDGLPARVLLVDDVTTDGRSKMAAAQALRQVGVDVGDALVLFD
ncbi:orotate phosphoribosyltransferase, partial [Streptomyces clavuligerus]|uniref:orotate phosphoribosyltransferase n=1 Tax=Streptomyces clavuligerus TaxID=1901 RepID=UPI0018D06DF0